MSSKQSFWKWNRTALAVLTPALLAMLLVLPSGALKAVKHSKKNGTNAPVVSRAQMELSQQMVRDAYTLSRGLEPRQRVALMTRLLYTMTPEIMADEKRRWAEELFGLAQQLPAGGAVEVDSSRDAAIATAAARLATYDADRALELLDAMPADPAGSQGAKLMAARLVFAGYMHHHGASGAQVLLEHGRRWSENGGFPYAATAPALAKLRPDEDAAEAYFRQELAIFKRGQEGISGVSDFAALLEQAVALEAISEESAEEAGQAVVVQLRKLTAGAGEAAATESGTTAAESLPLSDDQKQQVLEALNNVRVSAPKAYEATKRDAPGLLNIHVTRLAPKLELPKVDPALQASFHELADAMNEHRKPEALREVVGRGLKLVNDKYKEGECAECASPDAQSWALVALAAHAAPMTIGSQLNAIEEPFWRGYFLAIAAKQVGQPTKVADPTAKKIPGKEEAEPE